MHSQAAATYLQNAWRMEGLLAAMEAYHSTVTPALDDLVNDIDSADWDARFRDLKLRSAKVRQTHAFANEWYVVMQVTFTETYLHDVLCEVATIDESVMKDSQQTIPYAQLLAATSREAALAEMRSRWARGFVDDGGPARWLQKLERMGARGYPNDAAEQMERCWGVRHLVVHRAGVVSADFSQRHPEFAWEKGDRVIVTPGEFFPWLDAIWSFVQMTDAFFVQRYGPRFAQA
jgi:hypothetical protein